MNTLALNTDYVLRTGDFNPAKASLVYTEQELTANEKQQRALER